MPLAMSRPFKHPRSGVYYLRKGVPEDLRELVGKREEKRSLETRDPAEAKRRHAEACQSARGPDADRHAKLLIHLAVEGSLLDAYSQPRPAARSPT